MLASAGLSGISEAPRILRRTRKPLNEFVLAEWEIPAKL